MDRAAYNVLVSKFAAGIFDEPYVTDLQPALDSDANRKLALEAAEQSLAHLSATDHLKTHVLGSISHGANLSVPVGQGPGSHRHHRTA